MHKEYVSFSISFGSMSGFAFLCLIYPICISYWKAMGKEEIASEKAVPLYLISSVCFIEGIMRALTLLDQPDQAHIFDLLIFVVTFVAMWMIFKKGPDFFYRNFIKDL